MQNFGATYSTDPHNFGEITDIFPVEANWEGYRFHGYTRPTDDQMREFGFVQESSGEWVFEKRVPMIIICGKDNCPQCNLAKLACDIRSVPYEYKLIGKDALPGDLTLLAGVPIRSAPVIFKTVEFDGIKAMQYIGGYKELQQWLKHNSPRNSR